MEEALVPLKPNIDEEEYEVFSGESYDVSLSERKVPTKKIVDVKEMAGRGKKGLGREKSSLIIQQHQGYPDSQEIQTEEDSCDIALDPHPEHKLRQQGRQVKNKSQICISSRNFCPSPNNLEYSRDTRSESYEALSEERNESQNNSETSIESSEIKKQVPKKDERHEHQSNENDSSSNDTAKEENISKCLAENNTTENPTNNCLSNYKSSGEQLSENSNNTDMDKFTRKAKESSSKTIKIIEIKDIIDGNENSGLNIVAEPDSPVKRKLTNIEEAQAILDSLKLSYGKHEPSFSNILGHMKPPNCEKHRLPSPQKERRLRMSCENSCEIISTISLENESINAFSSPKLDQEPKQNVAIGSDIYQQSPKALPKPSELKGNASPRKERCLRASSENTSTLSHENESIKAFSSPKLDQEPKQNIAIASNTYQQSLKALPKPSELKGNASPRKERCLRASSENTSTLSPENERIKAFSSPKIEQEPKTNADIAGNSIQLPKILPKPAEHKMNVHSSQQDITKAAKKQLAVSKIKHSRIPISIWRKKDKKKKKTNIKIENSNSDSKSKVSVPKPIKRLANVLQVTLSEEKVESKFVSEKNSLVDKLKASAVNQTKNTSPKSLLKDSKSNDIRNATITPSNTESIKSQEPDHPRTSAPNQAQTLSTTIDCTIASPLGNWQNYTNSIESPIIMVPMLNPAFLSMFSPQNPPNSEKILERKLNAKKSL